MSPWIIYFPLVLHLSGWLEFLLQIFIGGPVAHARGWSVGLSFAVLLLAVWKSRREVSGAWRDFVSMLNGSPWLFKALLGAQVGILALAAWEARLPPHLTLEYDAINYHMALPRQHLLTGSLRHLAWSSADLWPLTLQFGMAPLWFMGQTINKFPQFIFALWAFALLVRLSSRGEPPSFRAWIPAIAVFGTHGVVIQLGTAMMDLSALYLVLAAADAWQEKRVGVAAIHLALVATMKAFSPFQYGLILALFSVAIRMRYPDLFRRSSAAAARTLGLAAVVGIAFLSRSAWVGVERAGTPLFPFAVCQIWHPPGCEGSAGEVVNQSATRQIEAGGARGYGEGRDPVALLKHFWAVSVPDHRGVNNAYDYPLGLSWLLWLILLATCLLRADLRRSISPAVILALCFWVVWWISSQQSRWLYPALAFGWLGTRPAQDRLRALPLLACLFLSTSLSLFSLWRNLRVDIMQPAASIQARQTAAVQRDPVTGLVQTQGVLFVNEPVLDHAPGDTTWILR